MELLGELPEFYTRLLSYKGLLKELWENAGEVLLTLYWDIGFQLREFSPGEIRKMSKELS